MKFLKSENMTVENSIVFDSVIQSIEEYKKMNFEDHFYGAILLVSDKPNESPDVFFDAEKYREGPIGRRIVIKKILSRILGKEVDVRPIEGRIADLVLEKTKKDIDDNLEKTTEIESAVEKQQVASPEKAKTQSANVTTVNFFRKNKR
jgi:hypothetical protein